MSLSDARSSQKDKPVLFERQRRLLTLLDALGGRTRNLDFQKLLFLYCQEPDAGGTYEFVPYKFGAFSFTSYADRRKLVERGLLADDEQHWQLTPEGKRVVGVTPDLLLSAFARRHRELRGDALVAETYRRFPYYATRSEIAERVLHGDERRSLETQADYDALFANYERHSLPEQREALAKIRRWVRSGDRVALTCYERRPQQCHRHCVAEALEREFGKVLAAKHL